MGTRNSSFASFNLFNLQLPGEAIYGDRDGWSRAIFEKKVDYTARALTRIDADVIGFQELWAMGTLQPALDTSALCDTHRLLVPVDRQSDKIICVSAVRSDMLLGEPEWIDAFPGEVILRSAGDDPQ
ncbi:MAG: hypothetical protein AAF636_20125 [Pseudomonadota bacterium]